MIDLRAHRRLFALLALTPVLVLGAYLLVAGMYLDDRTLPSPLIDRPLPPAVLSLPPLNLSASGADIGAARLDAGDLRGRVWLLCVWASWCRTCVEDQPILVDLKSSHDIILVGLDYKDDPSSARRWLGQYGNPFDHIVADRDGQTAIGIGVYGVPETYLIDRDGLVRDKIVGALTEDGLLQRLRTRIDQL